jgi:hypothetical protein
VPTITLRGMQRALFHTLRALLALGLLVLIAIAFVSALVFFQGRNDETREVDAIVILYPSGAPGASIDYALQLYRRGYAPRMILAGAAPQDVQSLLLRQGMPDAALMPLEATGSQTNRLRRVAGLAYATGIQEVLLVDDADRMLLNLKVASDEGLEPFGAPLPEDERTLQEIWQGSLEYWAYVLAGSD